MSKVVGVFAIEGVDEVVWFDFVFLFCYLFDVLFVGEGIKCGFFLLFMYYVMRLIKFRLAFIGDVAYVVYLFGG